MADIIVNTYKLNKYAKRISNVNRRISRLDKRLDDLYVRVGLLDLWNLMQADILTGYSWRLNRCQYYLEQTADDFENTENIILRNNDTSFKTTKLSISSHITYHHLFDIGFNRKNAIELEKNVKLAWDLFKKEISSIPKDAKSAGETLAWLEKEYGELPDWLKHATDIGIIDLLVPSSLQDAYTLTSGLLQGDLTIEEVWDVASSILSKDSTFEVICETLDYTFDIGTARSDEMYEEIFNHIKEGDILGTLFDGAEGFIDTIIGGVIDVIGDIGGGAVDTIIDEIPIVKGLNKLTEYGTGLIGWNEGDGYSIGGLIGATTEKAAEGLDIVTDAITYGTDYVTGAITDGTKKSIYWVRSWFD